MWIWYQINIITQRDNRIIGEFYLDICINYMNLQRESGQYTTNYTNHRYLKGMYIIFNNKSIVLLLSKTSLFRLRFYCLFFFFRFLVLFLYVLYLFQYN